MIKSLVLSWCCTGSIIEIDHYAQTIEWIGTIPLRYWDQHCEKSVQYNINHSFIYLKLQLGWNSCFPRGKTQKGENIIKRWVLNLDELKFLTFKTEFL